jgi:hypothetical protein
MKRFLLAVFGLTSLLASPASIEFVNTSTDASLMPCRGFLFVKNYRGEILLAASRHDVPPAAVAGVIAAEFTLNRDVIDTVQDRWLTAQLARHDELWWTRWAQTWVQEADRDAAARSLGNKWSIPVITSGYVMSFGPAQIQPRTAVRACSYSRAKEPACTANIKALMIALLDDTASIGLAALIQRYEADLWESERKADTRQDIAFLATLYSSGAEYRSAIFSDRGHKPNRMGRWIAARAGILDNLLHGPELDPNTVALKALCHADK